MPSHPRSPTCSSVKLPAGVLGRDYLKFLQLSVGDELASEGLFADAALQDAMAAVRSGSMRGGAAGNEGLL